MQKIKTLRDMKKYLMISLMASFNAIAEINTEDFSESLEYAQVIQVKAVQHKNESWCFHTKVKHNDQGWDHYAIGWEVIDLEGNQLGNRVLAHPHDNEQPFTRSQCGINIPKELLQVIVRAKCNQHGFGGKPIVVNLHQKEGEGYTLRRP